MNQHYIFGYGSLICKHSRSLTASSPVTATPVVVQGLQRVWSVRAPGFSAMGIQFASDTDECVGVLVPVKSAHDLARLDEREMGYTREPLSLEHVQVVPFLNRDEHYTHPEHAHFLRAKTLNDQESVQIWVYVPEEHQGPSPECPIVQSYVDTILRGCLDYSQDFAVSFLETTQGWHMCYVDDRHEPVYPRGDPDWSRIHSSRLDDLLQRYRPEQFQHRTRIS